MATALPANNGGYVVVDVHDKRVLLEVDDLVELAKANGISPSAV